MVRLSFDTEMWRRGISAVPLPANLRVEIEAGLRARLVELVELVLGRMRARRGGHSDDFVLPEELATRYFDHFEPPTPDEGPLTVVSESR